MRKIEIAEIENSYLNFFTPAIIVAAGYFLFNLIAWPLLFVGQFVLSLNILDTQFLAYLGLSLQILSLILVCLFFYFIVIPRLKIQDKDIDHKTISYANLIIVFLLLCAAKFCQTVFAVEKGLRVFGYSAFGLISITKELINPVTIVLMLLLTAFATPFYYEIIYRRTLIPLLEDRGLSSFHSVLVANLGFVFVELPTIIVSASYSDSIEILTIHLIYGFFAGLIYIMTRNVLFPMIFGFFLKSFEVLRFLGEILAIDALLWGYELFTLSTFIIGLIVLTYAIIEPESNEKLLKLIKKRSAPHIKRGIIGFMLISLGLLGLQTVTAIIFRSLTDNFIIYLFFKTIFYAFVFSIPFFLTIKTEYAQSQEIAPIISEE
ncbi:MAG: type II CAAX prenyl endopeptidase Rce1 family protein [Promethearchaeota archaeon]